MPYQGTRTRSGISRAAAHATKTTRQQIQLRERGNTKSMHEEIRLKNAPLITKVRSSREANLAPPLSLARRLSRRPVEF